MSLEETLFIAVPLEIFEESFTVQHKENTKKLRERLWVLMSFPKIKMRHFLTWRFQQLQLFISYNFRQSQNSHVYHLVALMMIKAKERHLR